MQQWLTDAIAKRALVTPAEREAELAVQRAIAATFAEDDPCMCAQREAELDAAHAHLIALRAARA